MVKFVLSEKFGGAISVDDLLKRDDRGTHLLWNVRICVIADPIWEKYLFITMLWDPSPEPHQNATRHDTNPEVTIACIHFQQQRKDGFGAKIQSKIPYM